jgi:surface antigen
MDGAMRILTINSPTRKALLGLLLGSTLALVLPALVTADPPPWAPAHGWRKKHDAYYAGYTGNKWPRDYGILTGRCDYEAVGAVLGGVIGGTVGARVGDRDTRPIAILVGTAIGAIVGAQIARKIEDVDRACIAHSLELAKDYRSIRWTNPNTGARYLLIPREGYQKNGRICRNFDLGIELEAREQISKGRACQTSEGGWQIES